MKTWAIANQKGGVGKTTTTITLAGLLASRGKRVLLVDVDPHGSLTSYFCNDPDSIDGSVYSLFQSNDIYIPSLIRDTSVQNLKLLPASTALATLDRQLGGQDGKGLVLKNSLEKLSTDYDFVLMDCPPTLGVLMVNALAACEFLVIPVQSEFLALKGLERMIRTIAMMNHARMTPLNYLIVPTFFDRRLRASFQSLQNLKETYPKDLWDKVIPVDTQFREASREGMLPSDLSPNSRGVHAYNDLLDNLLDYTYGDVVEAVAG